MVRTRYSAQEMTLDDPVVEIHESQLARLRARANLALPGAIIAILALTLVGAGIVRVERTVRELNDLAQGRSGVVAAQVDALSKDLAARTDPEFLARIAMEANAAPIAGASSTAMQALSVARGAANAIEPVTEHLALVDGQWVALRSEFTNLAEQGNAQAASIAEVSTGLESLRSSQEARLGVLSRRLDDQVNRLDFQDNEMRSSKTWTRAAAAGAAVGIGIAAVHAIGHGSR